MRGPGLSSGPCRIGRRREKGRGWVAKLILTRLGISASTRLVFRDVAQLGSAPEWGSGGRGFKSRRPDWVDQASHGRVGVGLFHPSTTPCTCIRGPFGCRSGYDLAATFGPDLQ